MLYTIHSFGRRGWAICKAISYYNCESNRLATIKSLSVQLIAVSLNCTWIISYGPVKECVLSFQKVCPNRNPNR